MFLQENGTLVSVVVVVILAVAFGVYLLWDKRHAAKQAA